ncbi:MAG TPA: ribosome maturation factor RimP [Bryobacteraceae bacterium]|nr:ribosome maturation factor RimP [Bryobacteraceae bacterium]
MSRRDDIVSRVTDVAERVCASEGLEVTEVSLAGAGKARTLRIFIDKPSGVTHADCELVSQQVGTILDVEDVIPGGSYHLEVSSPGVERKLTKPAHFQRFLGQKARIVLREPVENQKNWVGKLIRFEDNQVTLEPSEGKTVTFALDQIERANLKFEW